MTEIIPRQLSKRAQRSRYVVYVDGQAKSSFDTPEAAENEARRIREAFPVVAVHVGDDENNSVQNLGPTQTSDVSES
jgi:hypothetical protein